MSTVKNEINEIIYNMSASKAVDYKNHLCVYISLVGVRVKRCKNQVRNQRIDEWKPLYCTQHSDEKNRPNQIDFKNYLSSIQEYTKKTKLKKEPKPISDEDELHYLEGSQQKLEEQLKKHQASIPVIQAKQLEIALIIEKREFSLYINEFCKELINDSIEKSRSKMSTADIEIEDLKFQLEQLKIQNEIMKKENDEFKRQQICVICHNRERNATLDCGHFAYCHTCATKLLATSGKCAICKKPAIGSYKIIVS
jgi:hypothetical protein